LVVSKKQLGMPVADKPSLAKSRMSRNNGGNSVFIHGGVQRGLYFLVPCPAPGVAKPHCRQQVDGSWIGTAISGSDADKQIIRCDLAVFNHNIEVAIVIEDAGVEQFKLRILTGTSRVLLYKPLVREGSLRILVEILHVGVGRRVIEVVVALLHIFSMIALRTSEAEEPFFQNSILAIP